MDCIIVDDDEMSGKLMEHLVKQSDILDLKGVYNNSLSALNYLKKNKVDLIFLDIEMPDISGYDLLKTLEEQPMVIITSSHQDKAIEAFEHEVVDFLVKPVTPVAFHRSINRAERKALSKGKKAPTEIYVRSEAKIVKIDYESIAYVEALADYVTIVTSADQKYIVHSTMKGIQERLPEDKFLRVHRSFIINMDRVELIENQFIVIGKRHIPIGASYRDEFINRLNML